MRRPDSVIPCLEEIVRIAAHQLGIIHRTADPANCYSEAYRRLILNAIVLGTLGCITTPTAMFTEYTLERETNQLCNGPLDYFFKFSGGDIITSLVSDTSVENVIVETAEDEDHEILTNSSRSVRDSYIWDAMAIIEAKKSIDDELLNKSLGQLFSQMIDSLTRQVGVKAKSTNFSKGVLSTGQQTMFFGMMKTRSDKPVFDYYGKYSVNILPTQTSLYSGVREGMGVSEEEVASAVTAFYRFFLDLN